MQVINLPPNFDISKVTRADLEANVGKYFRLPSGQVVHLVKDAFGTFKAVPVGGGSNIQYVLPGKDVEIWTTPEIAKNFSNAVSMYELWKLRKPQSSFSFTIRPSIGGVSLIRRSGSYSSGSSSHYSGLWPEYLYDILAKQIIEATSESPKALVQALLSGYPTAWHQSFRNIYRDIYENIEQELYSNYNALLKKQIEKLAKKGVLDSTIASKVLGDISGKLLTTLSKQKANIERQALEMAQKYPIQALTTYSRLISGLFSLPRISISGSRRSGGSSTYDPTPYASVLRSVLASLI